MGQRCCTDRKEVYNNSGATGGHNKKANKDRVSINPYNQKKRAISSIGYHSKGDDAEKFDKAFEANDLKAFVALLDSSQEIDSFEERLHPWAEDPKTVGALAATQLAILASMADKDNPRVKDEIREVGAIPPLVSFLRSDQQDRVQTAVVALSFLTADCPDNAVSAYEAGSMPILMAHLNSEVAGMRAAAATTLRNMCVEDEQYRQKFVQLGGIKGLVEQLSTNRDPKLNHADVQLEAVLNLSDIIEDQDGEVIEEYAQAARAAGAEAKLQVLSQAPDKEVRESASEVLGILKGLQAAA